MAEDDLISLHEAKAYADDLHEHNQKHIRRHDLEMSEIRHNLDLHVKTSEITIPGIVKDAVKESLVDVENNIQKNVDQKNENLETNVMQKTKLYVSGWMMTGMGAIITILCGTLITVVVKLGGQ